MLNLSFLPASLAGSRLGEVMSYGPLIEDIGERGDVSRMVVKAEAGQCTLYDLSR